MKRKKKREIEIPKYMLWVNDKAQYLFVTVRKDAHGFVVDNAMQYLVYKTPNYGNWCNNDILENPFLLMEFLDNHNPSDDYNTGGLKLPDGQWKLLGRAIENKDLDYWTMVLEPFGLKSETTLIIEKI